MWSVCISAGIVRSSAPPRAAARCQGERTQRSVHCMCRVWHKNSSVINAICLPPYVERDGGVGQPAMSGAGLARSVLADGSRFPLLCASLRSGWSCKKRLLNAISTPASTLIPCTAPFCVVCESLLLALARVRGRESASIVARRSPTRQHEEAPTRSGPGPGHRFVLGCSSSAPHDTLDVMELNRNSHRLRRAGGVIPIND